MYSPCTHNQIRRPLYVNMVKANKQFELDIDDINLIEEALVVLQHQRTGSVGFEVAEIEDLKAKIFHQKNWYRPNGVYISG